MRFVRLLAALLFTATGALLWAAPAMALSAQAAAADPTITVYPAEVWNEDSVGIVLENVDCDPRSAVKLLVNGAEPGPGTQTNTAYDFHFYGDRHLIVYLGRPLNIPAAGHYDVAVTCTDRSGQELNFRSGFDRLAASNVIRAGLLPLWRDDYHDYKIFVDQYEGCAVGVTVDGRAAGTEPSGPSGLELKLPDLPPGIHLVTLTCNGTPVTYPVAIDGVTSGSGPGVAVPGAQKGVYVPVQVFESIPTPQTVDVSVGEAVTALVLGGAVIVLIGFPAEFVNKTIEANEEEINSWFRGARERIRGLKLTPGQWFLVYCGLTALLTTLVDPLAGFNSATLVTLLSFLVAVPLTTLVYSGSREFLTRRISGVGGIMHTVPRALLLAVIMTIASRVAGFQPGYVYGLVAGYVGLRERHLSAGRDSATVIGGSAALLVVSVASWVALGPVHAQAALPDAGFGLRVWDGVLCATFLLGVQTLVFGLIPLRFLDGHVLREWKPLGWALTYLPGIFLFILLLGLNSQTAAQRGVAGGLVSALVLFVLFGVGSLLFWGFFQLRGRRAPTPE